MNYAKLTTAGKDLLLCGENEVHLARTDGGITHIIQGFEGPVQGAVLYRGEVMIAVDNRVITTFDAISHWRDLMRGFLEIGDLALSADTLYIADRKKHRILGFEIPEEKPFLVAGNGDESSTDGPAKTASVGEVSHLSWMGEKLYFVDSKKSRLCWVEADSIGHEKALEGQLTHLRALACGQMNGLCGGFRIFYLDGEQVCAYDPISGGTTPLLDPIPGALDLALIDCSLFVLTTQGLQCLDLKEMSLLPVTLEPIRGALYCGPAIETNT